ncbi:MAG: GWxTD domain-containing protein [Bacteroidota bacterium]|nr:GWxTD domain-containing protein [Bacteroidota bacterium]
MDKKYILISIVLLLLYNNLFAQDFIYPKNDLRTDVDYARFYSDSSQVFLEMYYSFSEGMLTYQLDSGQYGGKIIFEWIIQNGSRIAANKTWTVTHALNPTNQLSTAQLLVGMQTIGLPQGDYTLTLTTFDALAPMRRDSVAIPFSISMFPTDREFLSDIELCTSIQASTNEQSLFYKNTLEVIPNPSRMYGTGSPVLYYYANAYNLLLKKEEPNIIVRTTVIDASGRKVITKDKIKPRVYDASVEVGMLNLSSLTTGTYQFRISLLDTSKTIIDESAKKFYIYRYGAIFDSTMIEQRMDVSRSRYSIMNEDELNQAFEYAKYIATENEKALFGNLTELKAKQKFIFDFWQRRSVTGQIKEEEYNKRIQYANDQLSTGLRQGWKTDRGRVLIVYGTCDEIERFPSSAESNPYEIWHYNNIQGGVIFVFVDREGLGSYRLVHSTHRSELYDEDWYKRYALRMR